MRKKSNLFSVSDQMTEHTTNDTASQEPNRPLSKLAAAKEVRGGSEHRTGTYMAVFEDSSTEPTKKFLAAVEFGKRSKASAPTWMVAQGKKQSREEKMRQTKAAEQALKRPGQEEKPLTLLFKRQLIINN